MEEDDNRIDKTYFVTLSSRILLLCNYLLCYSVFNYYVFCFLSTIRGSRYLVGIGIYFGKSKKKETFIYNSS